MKLTHKSESCRRLALWLVSRDLLSGSCRLRDATRLLDLDARRHILEVGVRGAQLLRYRVARSRRGEGLLEREPFVLVGGERR